MTGTSPADEALFRRLYADHFRAVVAFAVRRAEQPDDAADVVADTFLVVWRRLDDVPVGDEALPWLYGVARRVLANQRRSLLRRERLGARLRSTLREVPAPDPGDAADSGAVVDRVRAAMDSLSPADRELLQLVGWEELEPQEVAVVLDLPAATVRTRLTRARARLRAALGDDDGAAGHERVVGAGRRPVTEEES